MFPESVSGKTEPPTLNPFDGRGFCLSGQACELLEARTYSLEAVPEA